MAAEHLRAPIREVLRIPQDDASGGLPSVARILATDGVYEVRSNRVGTFVARLEGRVSMAEGFHPSLPRAPVEMLERTLAAFRSRPDSEALVTIVYDARDGSWRLVSNERAYSASEVEYVRLPDSDELIPYLEIHSHHSMPAFFSSKDSASEVATGLYGVVGCVEDELPQAAFRYSCGGEFREIQAECLFDSPMRVASLVRRPARREHPLR